MCSPNAGAVATQPLSARSDIKYLRSLTALLRDGTNRQAFPLYKVKAAVTTRLQKEEGHANRHLCSHHYSFHLCSSVSAMRGHSSIPPPPLPSAELQEHGWSLRSHPDPHVQQHARIRKIHDCRSANRYCNSVQVLSGLNPVIAFAASAVSLPRSFSNTTWSWSIRKVLIPVSPYFAGYAR